jgi:hypothetical protein
LAEIFIYYISETGGGNTEYGVKNWNTFHPNTGPMRAPFIALFPQLADNAIPIGTVTFYSTVSRLEEPLVLSVNILAHRGCDLVLVDWLEKVAEAGLIKRSRLEDTRSNTQKIETRFRRSAPRMPETLKTRLS